MADFNYRVVIAPDEAQLASNVQLFINNGWVPQGGVAVWKQMGAGWASAEWAQAMTKGIAGVREGGNG